MNGVVSQPGPPARLHLRAGVTIGQNTPATQAMGEVFASQGLAFRKPQALGANLGVGYDVISHPLSQASRLIVGTEVDFGMSMLESATMVPGATNGYEAQGNNGYMFHQQSFTPRIAGSVSVGVSHRMNNGLQVSGALRPAINVLDPRQVDMGLRLEVGKKLGGMVQIDNQVSGPGRGDLRATVGAYLNL
jgi:hypothetical protein